MNPPNSIEVMGQRFTILSEPDATRSLYREGGKDCLGVTDTGRGIIRYRPQSSESSKDQERDTITHETVHALFELCGLVHMVDEDHRADGAETMVQTLATALLDTIRRNPELTMYLLSE